jgi:dTDP-L-rhamnose 4-epimerase
VSDRVLVTGGSGFIGAQVADACQEAGHSVTVLDVRPPKDPGVRFVCGDVRDRAAVDGALKGIDVVVHQAAKVGLGVNVQDMPEYSDVNVTGTATLLAAMDRSDVRRVVLASSMVVYGEGAYSCDRHGPTRPRARRRSDLESGRFDPLCRDCQRPLTPELVTEDACVDPRNAYAVSKLAQEQLAAAWARESGGVAVALRYHNVYGPGLPRDTPYAGVAALFCSSLARREPPRVFEDGRQRRDFVHVRDVAVANVTALHAPVRAGSLRAYNIGSGTPRTVGQLAAELSTAVGGPEPVVTGEYRLGDVRHVTASSTRACTELGWQPRVRFANGIAELATDLISGQDPDPAITR